MQPKVQAVTDHVEMTGNAAAISSVKLIARVEGYLERQHFHDGALVKKGDLLFTIQPDQYKAQLVQAEVAGTGCDRRLEIRQDGSRPVPSSR